MAHPQHADQSPMDVSSIKAANHATGSPGRYTGMTVRDILADIDRRVDHVIDAIKTITIEPNPLSELNRRVSAVSSSIGRFDFAAADQELTEIENIFLEGRCFDNN